MNDYSQVYEKWLSAKRVAKRNLPASLMKNLPEFWLQEYDRMTLRRTDIVQVTDHGFEYLFDIASWVQKEGSVRGGFVAEDRLVAAFGLTHANSLPRDSSRMRGWLGRTSDVFGKGYDKGHAMGHALGGGLDINLVPQRSATNRGGVFRQMESYGLENPGVFCFNRPLYQDNSWWPREIEYGVLKKDGTLWVERFPN